MALQVDPDCPAARRWFLLGTRDLGLRPSEARACFHLLRGHTSMRALGAALGTTPQPAKELVHRAVRRTVGYGLKQELCARLWQRYQVARALATTEGGDGR